MLWAIGILTAITLLFLAGGVRAKANIRTAEDNWNVVFYTLGAIVFGFVDFVLVIVWLAIT